MDRIPVDGTIGGQLVEGGRPDFRGLILHDAQRPPVEGLQDDAFLHLVLAYDAEKFVDKFVRVRIVLIERALRIRVRFRFYIEFRCVVAGIDRKLEHFFKRRDFGVERSL